LYGENRPDPTIARDHWGDRMFASDRLSPDFQSHVGVAVFSRRVIGQDATPFLNGLSSLLGSTEVLSALANVNGIRYDRESPKLFSLTVEETFRDARTIARAIRTLCDAPIAIFDASAELPGLMLLLGVRSALRRGVTVVIRVGALDVSSWRDLAFTIRELGLVAVQKRTDINFERDVREAVVEGLRRLARRPFHYSDLPAFDALRTLGGEQDDYVPREPTDQVLVLCSFDRIFEDVCWPELQRALRDTFTPGRDPGPARRVIDLRSPELVSRRLFEAIRRNSECVADLTFDKANIYFELGTRLVANALGARTIRCVDVNDEAANATSSADTRAIDDLLGTRAYRVQHGATERVTEALGLNAPWPGGTLTAGYWYEIAKDSVDIRQEGGGRTVDALLWSVMEDVAGRDRAQGATPVMFAASNPKIRAQARQFTFEAMLAYVLVSDKLPRTRQDQQKRALALLELEQILAELAVDDDERARLHGILESLKAGRS
jgi:hypothetical protein